MDSGLYIHIPFCRSKCRYCSFVSVPYARAEGDRYQRALLCEIAGAHPGPREDRAKADTIYFGGGTPSLVPAEHLAALLDQCRSSYDVSADCEISMEANPGTVDAGMLFVVRAAGVNRISLGAQSFSGEELAAVGRIHTPEEIGRSMRMLRAAGFDNVSLDLILGLPGQTGRRWRATLDRAIALEPSHLSLYMLELDGGTPLARELSTGARSVPGEDAVADWYLFSIEHLAARGYHQYEISNFARGGCECRHNLKYWQRRPVLGFGVAAHSFDGRSRSGNIADLDRYLMALESGRDAVEWRSPCNAESELEELFFLGLRLNRGLHWDEIREKYAGGAIGACEAAIRESVELGLLEHQHGVVRLTRRGMLISNEVFQRFIFGT